MKLHFSIDDQVHTFKATERVEASDLAVLKQSLFQFFDSKPTYTILDLSSALIETPEKDLQEILTHLKTYSTARNLTFVVALTKEESRVAQQKVMEAALIKQVEILQAKLELREKMREQAEVLLAENSSLQQTVSDQLDQIRNKKSKPSVLSPLLEKLWSGK